MRRVVCRAFAPLSELVVEEAPDLIAGDGQVVIDVTAAGASFADALMVQGRYQVKPPLPFTPGMEVAGTVSGTGDRVMALSWIGGYASQVVVPAAAALLVPNGVSDGQAATLIQSYATMLHALTQRTTVRPGEWVAVLGAGGGIGLAAIDVAKALGANVVACASTDPKLAAARAAGADATIAYDSPEGWDAGVDLKTAIREVTGGGADVVVDPVGGDKAEAGLRALRFGGRFLVIGFAAGTIPSLPANQILLNSRTVVGVEWGGWAIRDPAGNQQLVRELLDLVAAGKLHPVEPVSYPLDDVARCLADLEERRVTGKCVLAP
jgi:NADPH2:quinone reductase